MMPSGPVSAESIDYVRKKVPHCFLLPEKDLISNFRMGAEQYYQVIAEGLAAENIKVHDFTLSNRTLAKRLAKIQPDIPKKYLLDAVDVMRTNFKQDLDDEAKFLIGDITADQLGGENDEFDN
jgi:hypothetical protein